MKLNILILIFFLPIVISAQGWQWAAGAGGKKFDFANSVCTDQNSNFYVTGGFASDSITFRNIVLSGTGGLDIYLVKYNASGSVLWAISFGGNLEDNANSISTDSAGNVYMTGYFKSPSITIGNITLVNAGFIDIFLAKFKPDGTVLWATRAGGTDYDYARVVKTDVKGNPYIAGLFRGDSINFGNQTLKNSNKGFDELFLVKYDQNGSVIWAISATGSSHDEVYAIALDTANNSYITGFFKSPTLAFGSSILNNHTADSADIFLVKFSETGLVLWATSAGGTNDDVAYSLDVNAENNLNVTGYFTGSSVTFGGFTLNSSGGSDIFLVKYNENGNVLFAKSAGGADRDYAKSLITDVNGNIYITGFFNSNSVTFGAYTLNNSGNRDIFLVKYSSEGDVLWAQSAGGNDEDNSNTVNTDINGNVYIAGYFKSPIIIFGNDTLKNSGAGDIFIANLSCPGTLTLSATSQNPVCFGYSNGSASAIAKGGFPDYSYSWNNLQNTSTTVGLKAGNYTVTATDAKGCTVSVLVTLSNPALFQMTASPLTDTLCLGEQLMLTVSGATSFTWSPSAGLSEISGDTVYAKPDSTIRYTVTGTVSSGCRDSLDIILTVQVKTVAQFSFTIDTCAARINFINQSPLATTYSWNFGDGNNSQLKNPSHQYMETGIYRVILETNSGNSCSVSFFHDVFFDNEWIKENISVPNVFTPNGDGTNDKFEIRTGNNCRKYKVFIFNRQGEILKYIPDVSTPWDGRINESVIPAGVYYYILEGDEMIKSGVLTVIK